MKNKIIKELCIVLLIVFVFIFFSFYLFNKGYHDWDIKAQENWGNHAFLKGIASLYKAGSLDYPPSYVYVLKFNSYITHLLFKDITPLTDNYVFISKTIPTICNLLIALILFFYFRKKNIKLAFFGALLYLFNIAIIYNTAYWGQVDSAGALLSFLSILLLTKKKYCYSVMFITLAVLTKFQSIVLVPIILLVILLDTDFKIKIKSFLTFIITFIILFLPMIIERVFLRAFWISFGVLDNYNLVTVNAFNFWNIISPKAPDWWLVLPDTTMLFGITLKTIGLFLLGVYALLVIYQLTKKRDQNTIVLASASIVFAFFMLATQIHERHLFPFFALMLLAVLLNKKFLWVYITMSITYLLNLMMVMSVNKGVFIFYQIQWIINLLSKAANIRILSIIISLINLAVLIEFSRRGIFNGLFSNLKEDLKK